MAGIGREQLECRIVLTHGHRTDLKTELGMYDPVGEKYVPLGAHGPRMADIDEAVLGLKRRILEAGHLLTFSDRRGPR